MSRGALSAAPLAAGTRSRPFAPGDLLRAAARPPRSPVYVDVDAAGALTATGACGAAAAACARLAPHVLAAHAVLALCDGGGSGGGAEPPTLELRLVRDVPALHELLLWFDERLLAVLDMPFLTLRNIKGKKTYECHECGERYEEPNPLKTHLFLRCGAASPTRLWRAVAARLSPAPAPPLPATAAPPAPLPPAAAARLEALAAEWGRRGRGHECVYCGKLYSRKYGLKIHIRTHTGYRPLRCGHCARAFGDPSNLNKHVRLHAAAAPAACARCGRVLARRRDLARHRAACAPPRAAAAT